MYQETTKKIQIIRQPTGYQVITTVIANVKLLHPHSLHDQCL
jgi:hypothetical protein